MNKYYQELLNLTYKECCDFLIEKYGEATDDYFSEKSYNRFKNREIKTIQKKKIARTDEGLYCHHIDEDKQILISTPKAILKFDIPYEYQKRDRLVYCNLIEHGILHVLIAKESFENFTIGNNNQAVGVGGYINFIRPNIIQWLINGDIPKLKWMINCRNAVLMERSDAKKIIKFIDNFLIQNYPIKQKNIDSAYQKYISEQKAFNNDN